MRWDLPHWCEMSKCGVPLGWCEICPLMWESARACNLHMPKALTTFVFIVLRNGLRRYILHTCLKVWKTFVFKVLQKGLLRYILLHMPKGVITCSKCYGMGCLGTYFTHAERRENLRVQSATKRTASVHTFTHAQSCHDLRVQRATESSASVHNLHMPKIKLWQRVHSATQWTASVHTLHMPKGVKPSCSKCYRNFCLGT